MRILMLKDYFFPEQCAGINLAQDLVDGFSENGNKVIVYTPIPCRGISTDVRKQYRKKKKEIKGNATIHRYWLPYEKTSVISRAFRYILQNIIQVIKGLSTEYDVVLLGSTPPTMGIVGTILKIIKRKPFVYNLQDIFPDSLVTGNITRQGSAIWKIGRLIEKISYKNADKIIVISESFKQNLLSKGVSEEKITVISNWIDVESVIPVRKEDNPLFDEFGISKDKFIVVYAGNFGAAQGADVILKAAKILESDESIQFVIFGGGSEFETANQYVENSNLKNVIINGLLPMKRVPEVYSLGDLALITCKKGVGMAGMPSKTWSIMACNTPIVAAFDLNSELDDIIKKSNAGICVQPEDADALAKSILELKYSSNICMYRVGREYVMKHVSKDVCITGYESILKHVKDGENNDRKN